MNMEDEAGLGLAIQCVQQALISAYEENCPLVTLGKGRKSLSWTAELQLLRKEVRRLFNSCRANNDTSTWDLYREAQRRYRKEVRKASIETWRTFCSSVKDLPRSARIHKALCRDPKIRLASWWLPTESVRNPRGKPWISCLLLTSPIQLVWKEERYPQLSAVPARQTGGWLRRS
jgi:hypothetical protein